MRNLLKITSARPPGFKKFLLTPELTLDGRKFLPNSRSLQVFSQNFSDFDSFSTKYSIPSILKIFETEICIISKPILYRFFNLPNFRKFYRF